MSNETYYIPTNFTDAGRVMGLFEIRNLIEAVLLTLPMLYLCLARRCRATVFTLDRKLQEACLEAGVDCICTVGL